MQREAVCFIEGSRFTWRCKAGPTRAFIIVWRNSAFGKPKQWVKLELKFLRFWHNIATFSFFFFFFGNDDEFIYKSNSIFFKFIIINNNIIGLDYSQNSYAERVSKKGVICLCSSSKDFESNNVRPVFAGSAPNFILSSATSFFRWSKWFTSPFSQGNPPQLQKRWGVLIGFRFRNLPMLGGSG